MRQPSQEPDSLTRLADHDLLTAEEERVLIARAQAGEQVAMDEIVRKNCRFILKVANWYHSVPIEDLFQEGAIGLVKAVRRYDLNRPDKPRLSTYAVHWIRAMMSNYCKRRTRHDDETVSLDELLHVNSESKLYDFIVSPDADGLDKAILREKQEIIASLLPRLSEREQQVLFSRFYDDLTLSETAAALAKMRADGVTVSRERIRQMEQKILKRLRTALAQKDTDPR